MLVFVHFDDCVETFFEGVAIGGKAYDRENNWVGIVIAYSKEFRFVAGIDVVAGRGSGVTC